MFSFVGDDVNYGKGPHPVMSLATFIYRYSYRSRSQCDYTINKLAKLKIAKFLDFQVYCRFQGYLGWVTTLEELSTTRNWHQCSHYVHIFTKLTTKNIPRGVYLGLQPNLPLPILLTASNCNVFVLLRRSTETNSCPVYLSPGLLSSTNPIWLVPK